MNVTFNPLEAIPRNDEEAKAAIKWGKDELRAAAACGIYEVLRLQGTSVLDAYEAALQALLSSYPD